MEIEESKRKAYRIGLTVFLLLAVLTIGEYFIGLVAWAWWAPLLGIALLKAFLIVRDYMHIGRIFAAESEVNE